MRKKKTLPAWGTLTTGGKAKAVAGYYAGKVKKAIAPAKRKVKRTVKKAIRRVIGGTR